MAASFQRSLTCESILDGGEMVNTTRGGGENRGEDSQDRLVVVHAGVKQGLDHSEGEFGVLSTSGSILGLIFGGIAPAILDKGTAEQSTIRTVRNKLQTKRADRKDETSGASASLRISIGG